MNNILEPVVTIATAIVGVAILAILISKKSNTAGVLQAAASGFSNALGTAISPVTGSNIGFNVGYPSSGLSLSL